ncbi:hypothetical protein [Halostella litorea]|uniref:hypothetical protein n=1 Tax=Halostella litorea TaxID=2528831 RepID=UPI001092DA9A|nr:hypothetical protein [Halostella litorea]
MRVRLRRFAVAMYALWLVAVVLHVAAQFTPLPALPGVFAGVVVGTAVFAVVGAAQIGRRGVRAVRKRVS